MSHEDLLKWLQEKHPNIIKEMIEEITQGAGNGEVRLGSVGTQEEWIKRHHPDVYEEWQRTAK